MLQESIEVVRRAFEAFNRGDWEAMATELAPRVRICRHGDGGGRSGGVSRG
jgi:ketosteroid isomerase-like protein